MDEIQDVDEYFRLMRAQLERYGRARLKPASVQDMLSWKFLVGFESPEGTWGISVRSLRSWAAKHEADPTNSLAVAQLYGTRLKEALDLFEALEKVPPKKRSSVWDRLKSA